MLELNDKVLEAVSGGRYNRGSTSVKITNINITNNSNTAFVNANGSKGGFVLVGINQSNQD